MRFISTHRTLVALALAIVSSAAVADPAPSRPDLVIAEITAARGVKLTDGTHLVPVTFIVRNIGNAPAGAFAVKATYRLPTLGEDRWVALHSAGRQVTIPSLAAGASRVVRALVKGMRPETNPATITLHADSCIGDEFMPVHCNVLERSERNNSMLKVVYVE